MAYVSIPSPRLSAACAHDPSLLPLFVANDVMSILDIDVDADPSSVALVADAYVAGTDVSRSSLTAALYHIVHCQELEVAAGAAYIADVPSSSGHSASVAASSSSSAHPTLPIASPSSSALATTGRRYKRASQIELASLRRKAATIQKQELLPAHSSPSETQKSWDLCAQLWEWFVRIGPRSAHWEQRFSSMDALETRRVMVMKLWTELPISSVKAHLAELVRWEQFCTAKGIEFTAPTITDVAAYIHASESRGLTVPMHTHAELTWLEKEMGLDFSHYGSIRQTAGHRAREAASTD